MIVLFVEKMEVVFEMGLSFINYNSKKLEKEEPE